MTDKLNHFQQENMRHNSWMEGAQKTNSQLYAQNQQKEHDIQNLNERFRVVDMERREAVDAKQKLFIIFQDELVQFILVWIFFDFLSEDVNRFKQPVG